MTELKSFKYDVTIKDYDRDLKYVTINIANVTDTEAVMLAADITKFVLNRDYQLSQSRKTEDPEDENQ